MTCSQADGCPRERQTRSECVLSGTQLKHLLLERNSLGVGETENHDAVHARASEFRETSDLMVDTFISKVGSCNLSNSLTPISSVCESLTGGQNISQQI